MLLLRKIIKMTFVSEMLFLKISLFILKRLLRGKAVHPGKVYNPLSLEEVEMEKNSVVSYSHLAP